MPKRMMLVWTLAAVAAFGQGVRVGQKLPGVSIADKGLLVPDTQVVAGRMALKSKDITYRPWSLAEGTGRVRTVYHLGARSGIDDVNKAFIDALVAAHLPEFTPDGAYKTITILNLDDAIWGTAGVASGQFKDSQRAFPWALYVADAKGVARQAWGLQPRSSAVIVLDKDGTVLFFKDGKLSPGEITQAVSLIKGHLGLR
jgi:hypothetical protein